MKKKIFILASLLCLVLSGASAAQKDSVAYDFHPHFYVHAGFGYQYTIGESHDLVGTLSSPAAQLGFGYQFTPVWGLRLNVNGWQSRAVYKPSEAMAPYYEAIGVDHVKWSWYYVSPNVVATMDLVNLIAGYKHGRIVTGGLMAGIGAHVYMGNNQAHQANSTINKAINAQREDLGANAIDPNAKTLEYLWDGTQASVLGKFGAYVSFHLTDHWTLDVEAQADMVSDKVNSKKANNPDWNINLFASAKYLIGQTKKEKPVDDDWALASKRDTILVRDTITIQKVDTFNINDEFDMTVNIFFGISKAKENKFESVKFQQIKEFMDQCPNCKAHIVGYADRLTGTREINQRISLWRAENVKNKLIKEYGIAEDRITIHAMGDYEQPFGTDPELNRVAIVYIKK